MTPKPAEAWAVSERRVTHSYAPLPEVRHRSRAPSPPNGAGTGASLGCAQDPDGPPSAQCSCARQVTVDPCSNSSTVSVGLRAPRLSPGPQYMPRSVSLVGLARKGVIPQNNSTPKSLVCDPVVLGSRRSCAPSYRFCRTRFYGTHWVMSRPSDGALRVGRTCVFIGDCGRVEASS